MKKLGKLQENIGAQILKKNDFDRGLPTPMSNGNILPKIDKPKIPRASKQKLVMRNLTAIGAQSELNITKRNGLICFKSSQDYRKLIDNLTDESEKEIREIVSSLGHNSFLNKTNYSRLKGQTSNPYAGTILEYLLNENEAIQIGDHVYKIRPEDELVNVIAPNRSWHYTDLYNLFHNPRIVGHSTNSDVISQVEDGSELWCSHPYALPKQMTSPPWNITGSVAHYYSMVKYLPIGIYFKLFGRIWPVSNESFEFVFNAGVGYIHWNERCGPVADYGIRTYGTKYGTHQEYKTYEGSKGLWNYFLQFYTWSNKLQGYSYGWICIRHNW